MTRQTVLDKHLSQVEEYGFTREMFPWSYNGHYVAILKNDGYIDSDGRLFLHLDTYCGDCKLESTYRGKLFIDQHLHNRVQTIKMLTLLPYHKNTC